MPFTKTDTAFLKRRNDLYRKGGAYIAQYLLKQVLQPANSNLFTFALKPQHNQLKRHYTEVSMKTSKK